MRGSSIKFSERLRHYLGRIADYEGGLRRVADGAGVDRASLEVFLNGQRGLSMESLDKLIGWIELDLVASNSRYAIVLGEFHDKGGNGDDEEACKKSPEKKRFVDDGKPF